MLNRAALILIGIHLIACGDSNNSSGERSADTPTPVATAPTTPPSPPTPPIALAYSIGSRPPEWGSGYAAENMFDATAGSYWCTPSGVTLPVSFTLQLPQEAELTGLVIDNRASGYETSGPRDVTIEVARTASPSSFSQVATANIAQNASTPIDFQNPTQGGVVRVTVTTTHGGGYVAIADLKVMGRGGTPAATPTAEATPTPEPTPAPTFEQRVASSQPVTPNPQPQQAGSRSLTASPCTVGGSPLIGESDGLKHIAAQGDSLYVADAAGAIRKYSVAAGDGCALTPDATFGTNGVLTLDRSAEEISVDSQGRLYASSVFGSWRIVDGQVAYHCSAQQGNVVITPRGDVGYGHFPGSPVRRIEFADATCTPSEWGVTLPLSQVSTMYADAQRIMVAGPQGSSGHQVVLYNAQGREQARLGNATSGIADDGICWAASVAPCSAGVCVVDSNCHALKMWSTSGEFAGKVDLDALLGVNTVWTRDIEMVPRGPAYIAVSVSREGVDSVYDGMIFRVDGL